MSYDIDSSGIFGGQEPEPLPDAGEQLPDAESEGGALDVDPSTLTNENTETDPNAEPAPKAKHVPLGALQEERQRRQEASAELARERENNRVLQDRFNQYLLAQQQALQQQNQPEPVQIPSFADDPEGHVKALTQQFEQRIQQLTQQSQQGQQYNQEAQVRQHLVQEAVASEAAFRAKQPDYDAAAKFFSDRKTAEYTALGMDAGQAAQRLANDYYGLTAHAKQTGQDPAQLVYNLAKAGGYVAAAPGKAPAGSPPVLTPQNPAPTSLSSLPGANTAEDDGKLTAAKVNAMSDAEFTKLCADMRRAAGGNQRPRT